EVLNGAELFANFAADNGLLDEVGSGLEASFDGSALDERAKNPVAKKTSAHAGDGDVEGGDESGGSVFAGVIGKDVSEEFEVADRDGIEDERIVLLVVADAVEVLESF